MSRIKIKTITYEKAIAELTNENPFKTLAKFILTDDKPNQNNQAVPFAEFERVAKSAIGMPVKMRFTGYGVGNHPGSIPIGVIESTEIETVSDDHHRIIAYAALWNDEFPEEVEWLKERFAEGNAPGVSYEINYKDFDTVENVDWIKETTMGAATFVRNPAYGTRTSLLALASQHLNDNELKNGLIALAQQLTAKDKGGNTMDEKELEALKSERDSFKAEAASKQSEIEGLKTSLADLEKSLTAKDEEIKSLQTAALLDSRIRKYTEAGFTFEAEAEKAEQKKTVLASFTDAQFDAYLADMVAIKGKPKADPAPAAGTAHASVTTALPKLEVAVDSDTMATLKQGMRSLARPDSIE